MKLIDKDAVVAEIDRQKIGYNVDGKHSVEYNTTRKILNILDTLEVKEVDFCTISENLMEAYEYLDFTHTSNLAHNKPMVAARLKKAIQELYNTGLLKLTHDEKYRIESLGLKAQKGEEV